MEQIQLFLSFTAFKSFFEGLFTSYCKLSPTDGQLKTFHSTLDFINQIYFGHSTSEFYVLFTPKFCSILHSDFTANSIKLLGLDVLIFKVSFNDKSININFI